MKFVKQGCYISHCYNGMIMFVTGLEGGYTHSPQTFTVETRGAGQGGLGLAIEGPSEAKMTCKDNRDGSCTVDYLPTKPGDYDIAVRFAEQHIPGE
jgi:filamin